MNLRNFYRQVRELEASLPGDYVVVRSKPSPSGGIAGRLTEVRRSVAAKLLAQDAVELVSAKEAKAYAVRRQEAVSETRKQRAAQRVQLAILTQDELAALPQLTTTNADADGKA